MENKTNKPDMKLNKKEYATQEYPIGSPEEQAALAKEVVNTNPRKMSEIITDKKAALKLNEDLLRQLQTNEY